MSPVGRPKGKFTQHRRMDRLREILMRHPKGLTLYEMAEALNVTPRTMRRYMKEIDRDFELEAVETKGGGARLWKIRSSELPRKVELRRTQAYAFLAARKLFSPMKGSTLYEEIDMAVNKLLAFSRRPGRGPNAGRADAKLEERFLYVPFAPKNYGERTEELDDLFQAVADLRPMTLKYRSSGKPREEKITIHPYAMVMHRDSIYCVGYHTGRDQVRTFVLDRMRDTQLHFTEHFDLPEGFDVGEYFQGEFGVFKSDTVHDVVVDFDAKGAEYVKMRRVHSTQKLSALPGGGVRLTMKVGNLVQLTSWVLEWGARARAVSPPELVERVKSELEGAMAGYAKAPTRKSAAKSGSSGKASTGKASASAAKRKK